MGTLSVRAILLDRRRCSVSVAEVRMTEMVRSHGLAGPRERVRGCLTAASVVAALLACLSTMAGAEVVQVRKMSLVK